MPADSSGPRRRWPACSASRCGAAAEPAPDLPPHRGGGGRPRVRGGGAAGGERRPRGGAWALVVAGAVAVAVPLWVTSRRELRQEAEARSAETLAIETDARLRLIVGDVVTPIAEVVGRGAPDRRQGRARVAPRPAQAAGWSRRRPASATANGPGRSSSSWSGARCGPPPGSGGATRRPGCSPTTRAAAAARRPCCWSASTTTCCSTTSGPRSCPGGRAQPGAGYRSFISVAVFCGDQNLGMLSVDAPEPHAFDDTDLNVILGRLHRSRQATTEDRGTSR